MPDNAASRIYVVGTIGFLLAVFVCNSLFHVGLYSDGSYYFLELLAERSFFVASWYRLGATMFTQSLAVLALHLGISSIWLLALLFSASLTAVPTLCYAVSTWILRHNPLALVANTVVIACCYFPLVFNVVGEFHVLYASFWLALALLLFVGRRDRAYFRWLVLLGLIMVASYELSFVTGLTLAAVAAWRRGREDDAEIGRRWTVVIAVFLLGALYGLAGIVFPRDPANSAGFGQALRAIEDNDILLSLSLTMLLAAIAAYARRPAIFVVAAILAGLWLLLSRLHAPITTSELNLGNQSDQRAQVFPFLLLAAAMLVLSALRPNWLAFQACGRAWPMLIPIAAIFAVYVSDLGAWRGLTRDVCRELARPEAGPEEDAAFFARNRVARYGWYWTWPVVSVLYRPEDSDRLLIDPAYRGWMPFERPEDAPDIRWSKGAGGLCGS